jgi:glucose-6-phosphate 1-dehydrogenase
MWFDLLAKRPGRAGDGKHRAGFAYKDFFEMHPSTGYETLIYDCLTGDQTCSSAPTISRTAGGRCNRSSTPGRGWRDRPTRPVKTGRQAADALLARDGRVWHRSDE